jgi:CubicO group peptidase (beta-lactamase class C family)
MAISHAIATPEQLARAESWVDSLARTQHLPALVATVSIGRSVVFEHATGYADVAGSIEATPSSRFRIGSVSKLLTATLLMRLAEIERLDLDAPLSRWMSIPAPLGAVTLRQLAGHTAGVRHYRGNEFLSTTHYDSLAEAIRVFTSDSLLAAPGSRYSYSSYGYNLIGVVIEHVTGMSFPNAVRRHVLDPLSLHATVPDVKGMAIPLRARLYMVSGDTLTPVPEDDLSGRWPSGGFLSTTGDLARLGRAMLAPGLLDAASLQTMLTPQILTSGARTSVGIGWRIGRDSGGRQYAHHGGSSNGGSAFLLVYPVEQIVVALASNALGQWSEREAIALASLFVPPRGE